MARQLGKVRTGEGCAGQRRRPARAVTCAGFAEFNKLASPKISYARNFEDFMLWRALGHVQQGTSVDI